MVSGRIHCYVIPSNRNVSTSALMSKSLKPSPFSSLAVIKMSRKSNLLFCNWFGSFSCNIVFKAPVCLHYNSLELICRKLTRLFLREVIISSANSCTQSLCCLYSLPVGDNQNKKFGCSNGFLEIPLNGIKLSVQQMDFIYFLTQRKY